MRKSDDQKGPAIRRQLLRGVLVVLLGVAIALLTLHHYGEAAINADPAPLIPGIAVIAVGGFFMMIACIRMLFHRPKAVVGKMAAKGLWSIIEDAAG